MSIYVLSCQALSDRYKIGKYSGTKEELIQRYITAIPDLVIHHFLPHFDKDKTEKWIHSQLREYRMKNINGRYSEWFTCTMEVIEKVLEDSNNIPIVSYEEIQRNKRSLFLKYINQENEHLETLYERYWTKNDTTRERFENVCRMKRIIYHQDELERLSKLSDIPIEEVESHKSWLDKHQTPDIGMKVQCWRDLLRHGSVYYTPHLLHLSFSSKILKDTSFIQLLRQIEFAWDYQGLSGRQVWKHLYCWLQDHMLVSKVNKSDPPRIRKGKNIYRVYHYELFTTGWVYECAYTCKK